MRESGKRLGEKLETWRSLVNTLRPDVADVPHLDRELAELEAKLVEAAALQLELMQLRARKQEATKRLRTLARQADMLRTRIGAGLRSIHGFDASILGKYGFKPRRTRREDLPQTAPAGRGTAPPPDGSGPPSEPS